MADSLHGQSTATRAAHSDRQFRAVSGSSHPRAPGSSSESDHSIKSGRERRRDGKMKMMATISELRGRIHHLEAQVSFYRALVGELAPQASQAPTALVFDLFEDVDSVAASTQTEISVPHGHADVFVTAADLHHMCATTSVKYVPAASTDCADAAAGVMASCATSVHLPDPATTGMKCAHPEPLRQPADSAGLQCAHPEPLLWPVVPIGVGSSLTTPKEPSTSSTTSAFSSTSSMATLGAARLGADSTLICAPGSSSPGAQNGAVLPFSSGFTFNDINEASYCDTSVSKPGETQCGPLATVVTQQVERIGTEAVASGAPVYDTNIGGCTPTYSQTGLLPQLDGLTQCSSPSCQLGELKVSQDLANTVSALPTTVPDNGNIAHETQGGPLPALDDECLESACSDCHSQDLASMCGPLPFPGTQCGPLPIPPQLSVQLPHGVVLSDQPEHLKEIQSRERPAANGSVHEASPVLLDAVADIEKQKDHNSQHLAHFDSKKAGSAISRHQCGPLPLHGGEDFNSQTLANHGRPVVSPVNAHVAVGMPASASSTQQCGPLPQHGGVDLHSQTLASPDGYVSLPVTAASANVVADTTMSVVGLTDASEFDTSAVVEGTNSQTLANSGHFHAIATEDFNSHCQEGSRLSQCGPLPLQSADSQNLANTCGEASAQHAPPVLFEEIPESSDSHSWSEPQQTQPVLLEAAAQHPVGSPEAIQECMRQLQISFTALQQQQATVSQYMRQ